jgi:hypothetical protein
MQAPVITMPLRITHGGKEASADTVFPAGCDLLYYLCMAFI